MDFMIARLRARPTTFTATNFAYWTRFRLELRPRKVQRLFQMKPLVTAMLNEITCDRIQCQPRWYVRNHAIPTSMTMLVKPMRQNFTNWRTPRLCMIVFNGLAVA